MAPNTQTYSYDMELYSRNFLNCAQRHSIVMLLERGVPVNYLFHNSLVSTDQIMEQIIMCSTPKYDFQSACLSEDDFQRVGVIKECKFIERYQDARDDILQRVRQDGFVLLAGDVFYFEHCPEFRNKHLFHLVALRSYDEQQRRWTFVDDNPASVLNWYNYPEAQVADFFDHNSVREYRCYLQRLVDLPEVHDASLLACRKYLNGYTDSRELLTSLADITQAPWRSQTHLFGSLHNAFALIAGSRRCFAAFAGTYQNDHPAVNAATACAQTAERLRNTFVQAKLTKRCSLDKLKTRASELYTQECQLLDCAHHLVNT